MPLQMWVFDCGRCWGLQCSHLAGAHKAADAGTVAYFEVAACLGSHLCHNAYNLMPAQTQHL